MSCERAHSRLCDQARNGICCDNRKMFILISGGAAHTNRTEHTI